MSDTKYYVLYDSIFINFKISKLICVDRNKWSSNLWEGGKLVAVRGHESGLLACWSHSVSKSGWKLRGVFTLEKLSICIIIICALV